MRTRKAAKNPEASVRFDEGIGWVASVVIPKGDKDIMILCRHRRTPANQRISEHTPRQCPPVSPQNASL